MQAELITAPGDGLAPALLLTLGSRLKAQYLFNVPEGFSRFVLEHKLRPGLGLRGVFATDLLCATGLPGLVMRLRGEGHGAVELFGPPGTFTFAASLRHFVHWKHPTVLVSECSGSEVGSGVYDDEHISVVPLHRSQCQHGGKGPAAWKPPLWMWSTSNERKAADDDDQDEGKQSQTELGAERLCGDQDLSKHIEARTEPQNSAKSDEESSTSSSSGSGNGTSCSSGSDEEESEGSGGAGPSGSGRSCPPGLPTAWALHAAQAARQPDGTWQAHGRQYTWVEGVEVPLLRRQGTVTGTVGPDNKSRAAGRVPKNESLLGFLCRIKASDTLLAVLSIKSQDDVERACEHPAVAALAKQDASR